MLLNFAYDNLNITMVELNGCERLFGLKYFIIWATTEEVCCYLP